ncbi:MAG: hypothetical protein ACOY3I_02835 [Verrucomicrobiota bacterium]
MKEGLIFHQIYGRAKTCSRVTRETLIDAMCAEFSDAFLRSVGSAPRLEMFKNKNNYNLGVHIVQLGGVSEDDFRRDCTQQNSPDACKTLVAKYLDGGLERLKTKFDFEIHDLNMSHDCKFEEKQQAHIDQMKAIIRQNTQVLVELNFGTFAELVRESKKTGFDDYRFSKKFAQWARQQDWEQLHNLFPSNHVIQLPSGAEALARRKAREKKLTSQRPMTDSSPAKNRVLHIVRPNPVPER